MFEPKAIKEEKSNTELDYLRPLQEKVRQYFLSGDKSKNEEIKTFNKKWMAAGGLWGSCIAEAK